MWYLLLIGNDDMEYIEIKDKAIIGREQFEVVIYYNDNKNLHKTGIYDMTVSRHHAELLVDDDDILKLRDLGSRNGTFIDGCTLKNWRPGKKMNSYVKLKRGNVLHCGALTTKFKVEHERNKLTLRIGESVILPKDIVSDLMKKGMPGSLKDVPYVIGAGEEGTRFVTPKLQVDIVKELRELRILTYELHDIKTFLMDGNGRYAYNKLIVFIKNWREEIKKLNPTICEKLSYNIHEAERQNGIITSDLKHDIICDLDILIGAVRKKEALLL